VPVTVVDTVGAGDSFTSALLAALWRRGLLGAARRPALQEMTADELAAVVDEAVLASALTCSRPGADPPTFAELAGGIR
jgi:fructokinase